MKNGVKLSTMAAVAVMSAMLAATASFAETRTWIGGSKGAFLTESNWDPAGSPNAPNETLITNTVTFTESGSGQWWYFSRVTVSNNASVTFAARFSSTGTASYLSPDKECFLDIQTGSSLYASYMTLGAPISGAAQTTLVKTGGGLYKTARLGSGGNLLKKARLLEGRTEVLGSDGGHGIYVKDEIEIGTNAVFKANGTTYFILDGTPLWTVNGVLNLNGYARTLRGIRGSGTITNIGTGVTLDLRSQGQNIFTGRIFGKLRVVPHASAPADACLVIGDANTLEYTDLLVSPTAAIPNPVKFKPGIGVFYVRRFPTDMTFYDTEGNPVELRISGNHLYVDASRPDDSGDGLTRATAYKTLSAAMASTNLVAAPKFNIVHVAPGVYSNGTMGTSTDLSRVEIPANVSLESDEGAEHTFIVGQASENPPANCRGCGSGAVRCVRLASGARIQGFTLTGGRTYATASNSGKSGGGVYCDGASSIVVDCIISNNVSYRGGGGFQGTYIRTKILSNFATELSSGLYAGCTLYGCVFDGNDGTGYYCPSWPAYIYNCVFGPNGTSIRADGTTDDKRAHAYNTIFMSSILSNSQSGQKMRLHNCITMGTVPSDVTLDDDCTKTNGFANAAAKFKWLGLDNDFRPAKTLFGRIVDVGTNAYYTLPDFEDATIDMGGNPRFSGAAIDLGPYEVDATRAFVSFEDDGGGIAAEGVSRGITNLPAGGSVTFTLRRTFDSAALCTGITVNGEFFDFDDYPDGWTTNITNGARADSLDIYAVYADKPTMWVDEARGNDSNPGYHPSIPKKTLAAAFTPTLPSGSIVYVAPGWYTNETMSADSQLSRVVVPNGVSLISLEGADRTFIGGAASPNPPDASWKGCGPNSVRCVTLLGAKALLRGFTCFGGRTRGFTNQADGYGYNGGGVTGPGVAEDCVFTNCVAVRGGGANGMTACRRCRFVNCGAAYIGSAINESYGAFNCVFDYCDSHIALYTKPIVNCTFLPSNTGDATYYQTSGTWVYGPSNVLNSAILCTPYYHANKNPSYTHCVFISSTVASGSPLGEGSIVIQSSKADALANAKMNADGSLQKGSPLIDVGVNLLYTNVQTKAGSTDKAGGQRVYNRTIDIGAYEYDWRGDFAKSLKRTRSLTVPVAGENVTTNAAGGVMLQDGDALTAVWTNGVDFATDYFFKVEVTGAGTLTYSVNGGDPVFVTSADGEKEVSVPDVEDALSVDFAFAGEGSAAVYDMKRQGGGIMVIFR